MPLKSQNIRANSINTRKRILDVTQELILSNGYTGTSVELIIDRSAITKSGFFYHFKSKRDLTITLLQRFLEENKKVTSELRARAQAAEKDPLARLLKYIDLFAELMDDLPNGHPGCLVAAYVYESQQLDTEIHEITERGMSEWESELRTLLEDAEAMYKPAFRINREDLSNLLTAVFEGGIIVSKLNHDPSKLGAQIRHYRRYIQFIFNEVPTV